MSRARDELFSITRDGKVLVTGLTHNDAFAWLHTHQGQSVDWAVKHEGYAIVSEGRSVPRKDA